MSKWVVEVDLLNTISHERLEQSRWNSREWPQTPVDNLVRFWRPVVKGQGHNRLTYVMPNAFISTLWRRNPYFNSPQTFYAGCIHRYACKWASHVYTWLIWWRWHSIHRLPSPSPLLVKRMSTTARAAPRSTAHHGLVSLGATKQLLSSFSETGSWLPSTAFDGEHGPRLLGLWGINTLIANVGRLSATLTFKRPNTASITTTL